MTERQPQPGEWWYQLYDHYPQGAYPTKQDAIIAGRIAEMRGATLLRVGKWKASVVAGDWEFVRVER